MDAQPIVDIGFHKMAGAWFQQSFCPQLCNLRCVERRRVEHAFSTDTAFHFDPAVARQ